MRFTGKKIIVTGAGSGLGRAVAIGMIREGGDVLLVDINQAGIEETMLKTEGLPGKGQPMAVDLSTKANCHSVVDRAIELWGCLDVLCNIAGVVRMSPVTDVQEEDWNLLVSANMAAPFWLSQAAIPHLIKSHGNIVNCASQSSLKGAAYVVPYSMTKGAINMMTRSMAMEFMKQPIRINAVSPGTMATGMSSMQFPEEIDMELFMRYAGLREAAVPDDVASLFLYVASDEAKVVHGAILCADGGTTAD